MNKEERKRDEMLTEIEHRFNEFLDHELEGDDSKIEMRIAVSKYFSEEVQKYTTAELQEKLKDTQSIINNFSEFLKNAECIVC
ncbi:Uncharacterized protein dnl_31550 [Desulfonema limicola]|uniref:Uncharacterized protein n=1 Tax=Desulfonema limicola TaxID=45656 RepID=A0A975B8P0_9BACT|nr:hypothetical protein [Desulfonema limicola]QTA80842.1 Uncharacterized protein dnl_31550 [Desulfonema limicola]